MSNAVFPSLPGLKWGTTKTPIWKTLIQESVSQRELRASFVSYPVYQLSLSYEVLRAATAYQELQSLIGFFNARRGAWDDFLYLDPDDNSVTDFQFGTGDGSTKIFQIARSYGGFVEPVQNLNGAPIIKVGGTLKATPADYSVSSTGQVTFLTAPGAGAAVTWSGSYYWRVRFLQDSCDFSVFLKDLWEAKKVELRTVKL